MDPISGSVAPDIPLGAIFDVALRAENKLVSAVRLVNVKLQCLRRCGIGDVEIQIVGKILNGIIAAKLLPPKRVRVWRGATEIEPG
jgi:hypothetical protein